ncbi:MAG: ADP-ribosylglycohydrolase family protein [Fimbriimonadaceae bacterium]|nr:ADP-ribosylglycohydrolase family protein [Fimbriimonadaceae bacterium]
MRPVQAKFLRTLLKDEHIRLIQMGAAPHLTLRDLEALPDASLFESFADLQATPEPPDLAENEPLNWEIPDHLLPKWQPAEGELEDKLLGAWQGRAAGCILGKPFEGAGINVPWDRFVDYLKATSQWPLTNYALNAVEEAVQFLGSPLGCPRSWRTNLQSVETDDDLRYTYCGLEVLNRAGKDFTTADVAHWWTTRLVPDQLYTAEQAALANLFALGQPHPWEFDKFLIQEDWDWVRRNLNPYVEWIGAAIRADGWAYGFAGNPHEAALAAQKDARLSHERNGEYSEIFFAALISASFRFEISQAVEIALDFIPPRCRLALALRETRSAVGRGMDETEFLVWAHQNFDHYHPVHAINNAVLCLGALLLHPSDFGKAICLAVMGGWDTDCTGATVGSVMGARLGTRNLPESWIAPLNNRIELELPGASPKTLTGMADFAEEVWRKVNPS